MYQREAVRGGKKHAHCLMTGETRRMRWRNLRPLHGVNVTTIMECLRKRI